MKNISLQEKAGRWYVSRTVTKQLPKPTPATGAAIGVALGLNGLATLSDGGESVGVPEALHKNRTALKRAVWRSHRTTKGSANHEKAKHLLARKYARLSRIRRNALHMLTACLGVWISRPNKRQQRIVLEEIPTSEISENHRIVPHIIDSSNRTFKHLLSYKAQQDGVQVLYTSSHDSLSIRCSFCHALNTQMHPADRVFVCPYCGITLDRDENIARNLKTFANLTEIP